MHVTVHGVPTHVWFFSTLPSETDIIAIITVRADLNTFFPPTDILSFTLLLS